ncbi:MAG: helix-turn-helix domain-containing protein, partial [Chromatiaceae bacterium]|nr:helix-turn-helix domain-containing protein [Chromatiaceae bacterium]
MNTTPFAANCRLYRARLGITQGELAARIDHSQKLISSWEGGRRQPNAGQIIALAEVMHCSPGDLLAPIPGPTTPAKAKRARPAKPKPTKPSSRPFNAKSARPKPPAGKPSATSAAPLKP